MIRMRRFRRKYTQKGKSIQIFFHRFKTAAVYKRRRSCYAENSEGGFRVCGSGSAGKEDRGMESEKRRGERLRRSGLKCTPRRKDVLRILEQNSQPVTAERIFMALKEEGTGISLSTVYRILEALAEKGLVLKISSAESDGALFVLNRRVHRHYMVCLGCHKMLPVDECPLGDLEKKLERETGFAVTGHRLEIYGYCRECQKARSKTNSH